MAARAYWQGQVRLALVSIPVEVYPATRSGAAISFRQIHEPSGKPIKYEKVAPGVGPVSLDEIVKGFEVSKGTFVLLDDDEIEAVKIESRKTLDLVQFVGADEIDVFYFEKPYFVVPADDLAEEAYIVLRDALKRAKKVALGQLSVRGREQLVSIKPCGKGLILETMRYADEVQKAQGYFRDIGTAKPDKDLLDLATTLIILTDPQEIIDRGFKGRAAKFYGDVQTLFVNGIYPVVERMADELANEFIGAEDVEEARGLAVQAAQRTLAFRVGKATCFALAKRLQDDWSSDDRDLATSPESLSMAADDYRQSISAARRWIKERVRMADVAALG